MGSAARLIVVAMLANPFTIADPEDSGMRDVVGFDTASPAVMADLTRGTRG
jgi:60 kDa SS-A/Ro ribonucleoprotein